MLDTPTPGPRDATRRIWNPVQQDGATFLETTAESGGTRTLIEIDVAPGGGNEPHRHLTYAEHFEVVGGRLTVQVGDATLELGPGERATAPIGSPHCFRNATRETVVFHVTFDPGHRGMEETLQVGYGLAADGLCRADGTPRNPLYLALLVDWSDIGLCGPRRLAGPVLRVLAGVARRRGVDRALIARYVTI